MNKYLEKFIALLAITSLVLCASCAFFDLDGNGRFDPVAYLEGADITVGWVDEDGQIYTMALDEFGHKILGQFIQAKTGYTYELTDTGGIMIIDPDGKIVQVKPKEAEPES